MNRFDPTRYFDDAADALDRQPTAAVREVSVLPTIVVPVLVSRSVGRAELGVPTGRVWRRSR